MEEELLKLGLNKNEAKIYLAGLTIGPATAHNLAEYTKIKRSTVYFALSRLEGQGLVSETLSNKKTLFQSEPPEKLDRLTKRMRRKVIDAELMLETLIPTIKKMPQVLSGESNVFVFRGTDGIKNVLLDVSASTSSWYVFGSTTKVLTQIAHLDLREILEEGEKLRQKSGWPKIFFITDSGILALKEFQEHRPERREIKILSSTIKSSSVFIIYQDKLAIINLGTQAVATVIQNREAVEVVKTMYQLIWQSLPGQKH